MKKENNDKPTPTGQESSQKENNLPGYPIYPESEDIYNNYLEEKDINPEDVFRNKESIEKIFPGRRTEKELDETFPGDDLDIPGSELDDDMENIGSEDEENNYYSIGGDNHDDLDENQGE